MKKQLIWWVVFLALASPFLYLYGLLFFSPRALGVDPNEVLLQGTGVWALRILLLCLCLSPLRRLGWKAPFKFRRMVGLYSFFYASLHLYTYLFGWIGFDWDVFLEDLTERPFIYLGMIAWTLLLVLALTSPKIVVRYLRKSWVLIHRMVYVIAILAWVHLWMQARASAGDSVFYGLIIMLLLGERVFRRIERNSRKSNSLKSSRA